MFFVIVWVISSISLYLVCRIGGKLLTQFNTEQLIKWLRTKSDYTTRSSIIFSDFVEKVKKYIHHNRAFHGAYDI